jgi:hypothetical protein
MIVVMNMAEAGSECLDMLKRYWDMLSIADLEACDAGSWLVVFGRRRWGCGLVIS